MQGDVESQQRISVFARLLLLIRPYQVFLPGPYDSYGAVVFSLMQRQLTRWGILVLMLVCVKPSMTNSKLVLFQMHGMMKKLQKSQFFFCTTFTLICSFIDALSPCKDQVLNSVFILFVAKKCRETWCSRCINTFMLHQFRLENTQCLQCFLINQLNFFFA